LYSFRRYRGLKSEIVDDFHAKVDLFGKKDHLRANFHNVFPKGFMATQIHVLYANFVKFGQPEIGKSSRVAYETKEQHFGSLSRSHFCSDRAQDLSWPTPDNILGVPQIRSLPAEL